MKPKSGVMKTLNCFLLTLLLNPVTGLAQETQESNEIPENFPVVRFSINPLYYSTGFYLGHVLNVRRVRPILSTFEGEMMIGFGSNPQPVSDRRCMQMYMATPRPDEKQNIEEVARQECMLFQNPWKFSFLSQGLQNTLVILKERPVVVFYTNYLFIPQYLLTKTRNYASAAFAVNPNLQIPRSFQVRSWRSIQPEAGSITGRIVKASFENPLRKSYELIIQESENADNFRTMSVNDGDLFRYISQAMLTGKLMRIEYVRLFRPHAVALSTLFNYATHYRVVSVTLLD